MKRILLASAVLVSMSANASAGIDLVADFDAATGTVKVTNIGDAAASISVVTIECKRRKPAPPRNGGGCPDPAPPALAVPYLLPAFPNKVAVQVPMLAPGASYAHALAFFPGLVFPSGVYGFKIRADDGNMVPESNEANNNKTVTKTVP